MHYVYFTLRIVGFVLSIHVISKLVTGQTVIEVLQSNNISFSTNYDDWFPEVSVSVTASSLIETSVVSFAIITSRETRTSVYHLTNVNHRNITENGVLHETIWLGSMMPISKVKNRSSRFIGVTQRHRKKLYQTGFASIYEESGRVQLAKFTTSTTVYEVVFDGYLEKYKIRSRKWSDFPEAVDVTNSRQLLQTRRKANTTDEKPWSLFSNESFFENHVVQSNSQSWISLNGSHLGLNGGSNQRMPSSTQHQGKGKTNERRDLEEYNDLEGQMDYPVDEKTEARFVVNVLVVVSHRAMCEYAGLDVSCVGNVTMQSPITAALKVSEAEMNNAVKSISVAIRFVQIRFIGKNGWDPGSVRKDIDDMLDDASLNRRLEKWRIQAGADLLAVIGKQSSEFCGFGYMNGIYSITSHDCLSSYVLLHELGHNFNCDHNREDAGNYSYSSPYAYGLQKNTGISATSYVTIMSYYCPTIACPRVPYYSSATQKLPDGRSLGNRITDNLRRIKKSAREINSR